jgi:hypothetical protein
VVKQLLVRVARTSSVPTVCFHVEDQLQDATAT